MLFFFLSLTRIALPYAIFVWPCAFLRPYHFDAYGPHTRPFLLWFSKEIVGGAVRVITHDHDHGTFCIIIIFLVGCPIYHIRRQTGDDE